MAVSPLGMTLEEAISQGQGIERPFRCPSHDDRQASASVNVLKGVWFCHACQAKGKTTGKAAPKIDDLLALMEPEKAARPYPEAYLEMFLWAGPKYWDTRLPPWLTYALQMGEDPITGDATFPVHTPSGTLAGIGRRHVDAEKGKRYLYPPHWSAAQSLFGMGGKWRHVDVITLVEGAADTAATMETGCQAFGVYGSGLHLPQIQLLARVQPRLILLGFDMDEAGEKAVSRAFSQLGRMAELKRVYWPENDPNECTVEQRSRALLKAVSHAEYGGGVLPLWEANVARMQHQHQRFLEDQAA